MSSKCDTEMSLDGQPSNTSLLPPASTRGRAKSVNDADDTARSKRKWADDETYPDPTDGEWVETVTKRPRQDIEGGKTTPDSSQGNVTMSDYNATEQSHRYPVYPSTSVGGRSTASAQQRRLSESFSDSSDKAPSLLALLSGMPTNLQSSTKKSAGNKPGRSTDADGNSFAPPQRAATVSNLMENMSLNAKHSQNSSSS